MSNFLKKAAAVVCASLLLTSSICVNPVIETTSEATVSASAAVVTRAEKFLKSGYNGKAVTVYDGTDELNTFSMNGRTYYQGLKFSGSDRYSRVTFNTEDIKTLSFTVGHVDGTNLGDAKLAVYLDDKGEEEIELTGTMNLRDITIDVSAASTVRFEFDGGGYVSKAYALANLSVDGYSPNTKCIVPNYGSSAEFLNSAFNLKGATVYDGETNNDAYNMNGRTYSQGMVFKLSDRYAYAQFNTENADTLSFTIGHVDNTVLGDAKMTVTLDGKGEDTVALTSTMNLMPYTIDVSGASNVRIEIDGGNYSNKSYAIGDLSVDTNDPAKITEVPVYDTVESFISSGFNTTHTSVFDAASKTESFNMNGRTYFQGVEFSLSDRYSYVQFNTENVNKISFTIGHVDGTVLGDATLNISLDGKGEDTVPLTSTMNLLEYSLDVSRADVVRFEIDGNNYSNKSYAFGDITVDTMNTIKECEVPDYGTSEKLLTSAFNTKKTTVYDASSKTDFFKMNGRTYYQGIVFSESDRYSYAQFNTENVDTISFTLGHVDDTVLGDASLTVYYDDKGEEEIPLTSNMELLRHTLDVRGVSVVRLYFDGGNYSNKSYAIGDVSADGKLSEKLCDIPVYKAPEELLASIFNTSHVTMYDGTEKTKYFNVNSEPCYQGLVFKLSDRYSYAKINTENLSSISFKIAHVDNEGTGGGELTFVVDDNEIASRTLTADMAPTDYTLDVENASTVRFYIDGGNYSNKSYALYDFVFTEKQYDPIESDTDSELSPDTDTDTESEIVSDNDSDSDSEDISDTDTQTDGEDISDTDTETDSEDISDTDTETDSEDISDTDTETDSDVISNTDTDSEYDSDPDSDELPEQTAITLDKSALTMKVGENAMVRASITPVSSSSQLVTWISSSESVVRVFNGTLVATGVGEAIITAVTEDGAVATCAVTVAPADEPAEQKMFGDLDYDTQITATDALMILRMSVGLEDITPVKKKLSDVDSDNEITAADSLEILRYSVGLSYNQRIGKMIEV